MRTAIACVLAIWAAATATSVEQASAQPVRLNLYHADPNHLWNRLHRHFHVRVGPDGQEHGLDSVDPLVWRETRYLLTGPSHEQAVRLLDEFLDSRGETLIADPVKRAVFQHDVWALFDWLAETSRILPEGRKALMPRLARILRRVALTRDQIERLPDTYRAAAESRVFPERHDPSQARAFLPPRSLQSGGTVGQHRRAGADRAAPRRRAQSLCVRGPVESPGWSCRDDGVSGEALGFPSPVCRGRAVQ